MNLSTSFLITLTLVIFVNNDLNDDQNVVELSEKIINQDAFSVKIIHIYGSRSGIPSKENEFFEFERKNDSIIDVSLVRHGHKKVSTINENGLDSIRNEILSVSKTHQANQRYSYGCTSHYQQLLLRSGTDSVKIAPTRLNRYVFYDLRQKIWFDW